MDFSTIPLPKNIQTIYFNDGDTEDIIGVIEKVDRDSERNKYTKDFAIQLEDTDEFLTCYNIWQFVKNNIRYAADKSGHEVVQYPNYLFYNGKGDCKSFSILTGDLLRNVHNGKIDFRYRFISQDPFDKIPKHVYVVATLSDGYECVLDAVYSQFDREPYRYYKTDRAAFRIKGTAKVQGCSYCLTRKMINV